MSWITLVTQLIPVISKLYGTVQGAIKRAKEEGELTPEREAEFQAKLAEVTSQEHWQTDAERED